MTISTPLLFSTHLSTILVSLIFLFWIGNSPGRISKIPPFSLGLITFWSTQNGASPFQTPPLHPPANLPLTMFPFTFLQPPRPLATLSSGWKILGSPIHPSRHLSSQTGQVLGLITLTFRLPPAFAFSLNAFALPPELGISHVDFPLCTSRLLP
jgi:hypothetical protein